MSAPTQQIQIPPGLFVVTTYGSVTQQTTQAIWDLRSFSEKRGLQNAGWMMVPGTLVEKARNDAVRHMLAGLRDPEGRPIKCDWLCFCDADMVPPPDSLTRILGTAYGTHSWADVVGGYCNLRGELAIPTIDTGTGTWESTYPGRGPVEVIRTGAAFLLCKRHVFERIPAPWFRLRVPARPLDFMAEVDNWARIKMDGKNPFHNLPGRPWEKLMEQAHKDPSAAPGTFVPTEVGEDSGFCDRVRAAGMRIIVDTNIVIPHLDTTVNGPETHKRKMGEIQDQWKQAVGLT